MAEAIRKSTSHLSLDDQQAVQDDRLRTLRKAARFLSVSLATVYRLGHAGELEMIKTDRGLRVTQHSLDRLVENAKRVFPEGSKRRGDKRRAASEPVEEGRKRVRRKRWRLPAKPTTKPPP